MPKSSPYILPNDTERQVIVGRTGSGKTQAGIASLSMRSIETRPWIVFNYKGDELINDIPFAKDMDLRGGLPKAPGIYIVRPLPDSDADQAALLWRVHARGGIGLYIDEGYMLARENAPTAYKALRAVLTQGRSLRIPTILLTQRPVWIDRFAFTEAERIQIFQLTDEDDFPRVQSFVPVKLNQFMGPNPKTQLPDYHSIWHDIPRHKTCILSPVDDRASILATFAERLAPRRRII